MGVVMAVTNDAVHAVWQFFQIIISANPNLFIYVAKVPFGQEIYEKL